MNVHKPIVYIVDDDPAVRDSLTLMIEQAGISVKSFASAQAFLNAFEPDSFGCIIIDVKMPEMDGLQLQNELINRNTLLPIIFLTGHGDIPMSVRAIKAGAMDFLTKPVTREKLLSGVRSAFAEAEKKMAGAEQKQNALACLNKLTQRERQVMSLAVQGRSNKEIAVYLSISHRTVEIHKSNIMRKTNSVNLLDLVRITRESDLDS